MKTNCSRKYGSADGEWLKADAHRLLEARRDVFVRRGRRAMLLTMLEGNGRASADDVRAEITLPSEIDPRCLGSVPGRLARAGIIRADGYAKTCRPTAHARPLTLWALADRAAAVLWLAAHPDLLDPDEGDGAAGSQRVLFPIQPENEPGAAVAAAAPGMEI